MPSMPYLIFDAVIALLLLISLWRGYRKGFVLTLCGFLALFVAFIGAMFVSSALAKPVSQVIRPAIETSIQQYLENNGPSVSPADPQNPGDTLDLPLSDLLQTLEQSKAYRSFAQAIQKAVEDGMVAAGANAAKVIADYIALQIARIFLFCVAFVLILIVWFFISHALDLAFKLPVLSTLNRWSGGALGLLRGGLMIYIACWLLKGSLIPQAAIAGSYLLKFFCTASPLTLLS